MPDTARKTVMLPTSELHIQRGLAQAKVDKAEALRYVGHTGQDIDEPLATRLDRIVERCEAIAVPSLAYRIFPVAPTDEGVRLEGSTLTLPGNDIATHLQGACACGVLVVTLGLRYEQELQRLNRTSGLDGLLFSTAGSSLVESAADICEARIVAQAHAAGLQTNWRFSPGYGDLPLALQPEILRVLDAQRKLGVTANASNLLIPTKSTTAVLGLFQQGTEVSSVKKTCAHCNCAPHCTLRKQGTPCYR